MSPVLRLAPPLCLLLFATATHAQIVDRVVPQHVLDAIQAEHDDGSGTIPKYMTDEERLRWVAPTLPLAPARAPVAEQISTPPEYALNEAIMMRWDGTQAALQTEMIVAITTLDERARVDLFVSSVSQQNSVTSSLTTAGADLSRVNFMIQGATGRTIWMRDYGPRFINADAERAIVDHTYNRNRPADNAVPGLVASLYGEPSYLLPLCHGGGNYHSFGTDEAFMTSLIVDENDGTPISGPCSAFNSYNGEQIKALYASYQGVDLNLTDPLPQTFDSTQHIDMWMLPVSDSRVIISEYPDTGGIYTVPRAVSEATAADLASRGYQVFRTPGRRISPAHYTYTNSVIVNNIVLVCQFFNNASVSALNAQALSVFAQALPDKQIVPVNCSNIISQAGAIHCIVMHVPFPDRIYRSRFDD